MFCAIPGKKLTIYLSLLALVNHKTYLKLLGFFSDFKGMDISWKGIFSLQQGQKLYILPVTFSLLKQKCS